ncbi:MAG: divergent PAP2 family protein [Defluviitaleaceae bacterium]|nr:divergent PAP2 family protein [Defluviitaleaceae bacterium]
MHIHNILEVFTNSILLTAVAAWFIAQATKVVSALLRAKRFDPMMFFSLGGMPSSHTSFIMAMTVATGFRNGFNSSMFAISAALCLIVMVDAAGIRRAAGTQAAAINMIVENLEAQGITLDKKLKELIGHTPVQVLAGAILGVIVAVAAVLLGFVPAI